MNNITGTWIGIFVLLALYYLRAAQTLEDPIALNMCTTCKVCKGLYTYDIVQLISCSVGDQFVADQGLF